MKSSIASFALAALWLFSAGEQADAADLYMVDAPGCPWCAAWEREIGPIYPKTEESRRAPLTRVDIGDVGETVDLKSRVIFTPTFLLVEDGRELDRMEGYTGDEFFWVLLNQMLDRHLKEDSS
ncbi:MAG: hypothetical protein QNJ35_16870 [Paracoccaceae bacterium]|nr:hypothetical protein [Paracoccaceae bacterium]